MFEENFRFIHKFEFYNNNRTKIEQFQFIFFNFSCLNYKNLKYNGKGYVFF